MDTITVAGLPASLGYDSNHFYATATFQNVRVQSSPLVLTLDPPVQSIDEISFPDLVDGLAAAIRNGATIVLG